MFHVKQSIRESPESVLAYGCDQVKRNKYPRDSMAYRLTRFFSWLQYRNCYIRDVNEKLIRLIPNRSQLMVLATMMTQALAMLPIRIVCLKARKVGVSTIIQAFTYFNCRFWQNQNAIMLAHQSDSTEDIFRITARIAQYDVWMPGAPKPGIRRIPFRGTNSLYWCQTAGGEGVGAGGTPNMLHRSELALWLKRKKEESDYTSGNAVPTTPTSIIVDESTARGQDLFWGRFKAAHLPEHPYEPVFIPWFMDSSLRGTAPSAGLKLDEEEALAVRRSADYGMEIPMEALAWRRDKILEIGDVLFKQEYPTTPEEAIESRRGLIIPGLRECLIDELPFVYSEITTDERVGGWDYGYSDHTVIGSAVYRDQKLYIFHVYRCREKTSDQYAAEVRNGHTYYGDPANPGPMRTLERDALLAGVIDARFRPAPRAKGTGTSVLKQELDILKRWVLGGRVKILRSCSEQLIIEADSFEWNEQTGEPDQTRTKECGHFDTLAMLRYMTMGVALAPVVHRKKRQRKQSVRAQMRL